MRITVWGINYHPEVTGIGVYNTDMCEYLARRGHEVTMVTSFCYYPSWRKRPADRGVIYREEQVNGVRVLRCWTFVPRRPTVITRIIHEASFVLGSALAQLLSKAPDVYVVVSHPLLLGLFAWVISRLNRRPFIFHVQDLQPDAALSLSMLKEGWFIKTLRFIERLSYRKAFLVSGISPGMIEAFQSRGVPPEKTFLFPNWVTMPVPEDVPPRGAFKESRGIASDVPIVSYAGNMGVKQGLELIVEAARLMRERKALFVIAGDGAQKAYLEELVGRYGLGNVRFEAVLPESEHTALLVDSDVCLITQKKGTGASFLPSKLLKILSLSRPIVTNADDASALYRATEEGKFGIATAPEDAEQFASAITRLLDDPSETASMGAAGYEYVQRFEREYVLSRFENALQQVTERRLPKEGCKHAHAREAHLKQ